MSLNRQFEIKAELIAHMVVAGVARPKIAVALNLTYKGLDGILSTPEYQTIEARVAGRATKQMQEITDRRIEKRLELKTEVEDAVSEAIHLLLQKLRKEKDLRAALEILDRDPRHDFTKASRQAEIREKAPAISSEALASAIKEADMTQKIIWAAENLETNQTFPKA